MKIWGNHVFNRDNKASILFEKKNKKKKLPYITLYFTVFVRIIVAFKIIKIIS